MYSEIKTKTIREKYVAAKPDTHKLTPDEERKKASDERWLKSKRSSTELCIMDAGRQPNEKKK